MKIRICSILLLIIAFTNCSNTRKFEWSESRTSPLGYPVYVYRGGLISKDNYTSLFGGITNGEWGSGGGGMSGGIKQLPDSLHVIWVSYAEGKTYEINTPIDYNKMYQLFEEGYYFPSMNSKAPEPFKEEYYEIIVGFAPGGMVVIWLNGAGRQTEIGRYQGHEIKIPQEEIDALDEPERLKFTPEYREHIMQNKRLIPIEMQKENQGKPIPFDKWDNYRKEYNIDINTYLPKNAKIRTGQIFYYNAENICFFGKKEVNKYPEVLSDKNLWSNDKFNHIPKRIVLEWQDKGTNWLEIIFAEEEIFNAFKELGVEENNTEPIEIIIRVNEIKTNASVQLNYKNQQIDLLKSTIEISY